MEEQINQTKSLIKILAVLVVTVFILSIDFGIQISSTPALGPSFMSDLFALFILFPLEIIFLVSGFFYSISFYFKTKNSKFLLFIILFGIILVSRVLYFLYNK